MAAKVVLVLCVSALFAQSAYSACLGNAYAGAPFNAGPWNAGPWNAGCGAYGAGLAFDGVPGYGGCGCGVASTGGGLACASASAIPPAGVSVLSENVYEGGLAVGGNLPFLGSVGLEGVLPTVGAGAVSYSCGAGICDIAVEEGPIATGIAPFAGFGGYDIYGAGYGAAGWAGPGLAGAGFNGLGCGGLGGYGYGLGCGGLGGYGYGLGAGYGAFY